MQTNFFNSKEHLEQALRKKHSLFNQYTNLHGEWKSRFIDYMTGKKTLPLTYDPFFKCIFNPDIHPDYLSDMLSAILGQRVYVQSILPSEEVVLSDDSLLIMDIIVRLTDGSLANVEIQKIPYQFPAERISCYSADLLLRQYTRLKSLDNFRYSDLKKVYTIILFEKSTSAFHDKHLNGEYFHHGKTVFNTGLQLELLQEYFLISLDVFRENGYAKKEDDLTIWLSLLSTETMDEAERLIRKYPWLEAIFEEMSGYVYKPEEVLSMFSDALKIMDKNTVRYMMDEMQEELSETKSKLSNVRNELSDTKNELSDARNELSDTKSELSDTKSELSDAKNELSDTQAKLISTIISMTKEFSGTKEQAAAKLISDCGKTNAEALALIEKYW